MNISVNAVATDVSRRLILFATLALALALAPVNGAPPPAGVAPINLPAGGFGIDGELLPNTPAADVGDWLQAGPAGTGGAVLNLSGVPLNPKTTFHFIDRYGNQGGDLIFAGGLKWTDNPNIWKWTTGKPSSKTEINNALMHIATDAEGHIWVAISADRLSTSGDSYIDFEFLQNTLTRNSNGTFTSAGPNGGRTTNDVLLSLAFTGGGKVADFFAWMWRPDGIGGFGYVDVTTSMPAGRVFAALNSNSVAVPYGAFGKTTYAANAFAEAAVDLTALLGNFDQCLSFGFKTIMVKTKASSSTTASIEDFLDPIQYSLNIGPGADAGADQTRCIEGESTAFPLNGVATAGLNPVASATWSLVAGTATIDSVDALTTVAHVSSETATLRLTVVQSNGCMATDDIVLRVAPLPVCSIEGPILACPFGTNTFRAPAGMKTYSWSITGNGSITGPTNQQTVTVASGSACAQAYVLRLDITTTNNCPATCSTEVLVNDTLPPVITCPINKTVECTQPTTPAATGAATATDACARVTVTFTDAFAPGCGNSGIISRTWTATDTCGNVATCVQTITVVDTTLPTIICPSDKTVECAASTDPSATGSATASDTCGSVNITFTDSFAPGCGNGGIITRTWKATDACGNIRTCVQRITIVDTTRPIITCPSDTTVECTGSTAPAATGSATATDACGNVAITFTDTVTNRCGGTKLIKRTWKATDACSNLTTCVQTITVVDTTPPTITCPADKTVECTQPTTPSATGTATATDTCGTVTVTFTDSVATNCGNSRVISRTWKATDACGNAATCVQTIGVVDTTPPVITCPTDRTVECTGSTAPAATGTATASDTCGSVSVSYTDAFAPGCGNSGVITRTWKATDACGNIATCAQKIAVVDTTRPTIACPTDKTVECTGSTDPAATGTATASDTCGSVAVSYTDAFAPGCGNSGVISRTWKATDACGNIATCVQKITIMDRTPPTIACPTDSTVECTGSTDPAATGTATGSDTCGNVTITFTDSITNRCAGTKVIKRTWKATDACGNITTCAQIITVVDTTPPTITAPADRTLECPANTATNATGVATGSDTCSTVTIAFADAVTNQCGGTKVITRTWTATDQCGNRATATQTISVRDTIKPTITCPADRVLECPANTATNATGVATATDGCSAVTVVYSDSVSNGCAGTKVISRTWTATDACGNSISCLQTITVRDTLKPSITAPTDLVLECGASTSTNATGTATAQDGCGSATISYSDSVSNSCGGTRVISRTWTATDQCGNSISTLQKITVRDTTPPALTLPANRVLDCPGDTRTNVTGVATAVDICGSVTVSYSDTVSNSCGITRTVRRTWTATDQCGNTASGLQTITVRDTTRPTINCPTLRVQCLDDVPAAYASLAAFQAAGGTASDACDSSLTFSMISDSGLVGHCPGTVTRVYRVMDDCGNFTDCTQTVTVDDTIAPTMTCPTNLTLECGASMDPASLGTARATDNCSTNLSITYTDALVPSEYDLKFYVADPDSGTGPYGPTYLKFAPGSLPCPESARLTGRALDPLRNAVAYSTNGQLDALTSIGNVPMAFGQIVPFETVIQISGGPGLEHGTIEFTAAWSTHTTSNNRFGYDTNYMVYCAFVDAADPGSIDPHYNARVESYSSEVINRGTIAERIQGTFRISGLDTGDRVVVEIWVVLMPNMPEHSGGTVAADLVSAQKVLNPPVPITVGNQTDSLGNLSKIGPLPPPQQQPPLGPLPVQPAILPGALISVTDRTWSATDDCANRSTCVQRITVRDTTPPVLSAPLDRVLECPADLSTNNTGVATVTDVCGSLVLTYSDIVSNSCGGTKTVWRTWTATDGNHNTNTAVQVLTVRDTIAPTITCPPNLVLECPADTRPDFTGIATAVDGCSQVTVSHSDSVVSGCGGTKVITRTWTAVDACGNITTCAQTITVRDTTPPTLVCSPDRSVSAEEPWTFDIPVATDTCGTVTVRVLNTATNMLGDGACITTCAWEAVDECGNRSTCQQTISVASPVPLILEIYKLVEGQVTLRWPAVPNVQLEACDSLASLNWTTVSATPVTSNGFNTLAIPSGSPHRFYRLYKPAP
jgi:large repetitive protein